MIDALRRWFPVIVVVLLTALILASIGHLYVALEASERRNAEMHRVSMEHRQRLDAESRDAVVQRQRIADQLDKIERRLELSTP